MQNGSSNSKKNETHNQCFTRKINTFNTILNNTKMSNQQLEEKNQEDADRKLAKILGISYEEITELDYVIHENESEDGLVYGQYVEFNKDVSPEILKKIKGIDQNFTVYI